MKSFKQFDEAIERQAKDRKKLSQPHSVSGSRRDHSHDVDSALTDHVPRKGKGRMRPASKKEMRVSAMRDAGIDEAVKGQDTESRREGAKERAADKKSGKIRKNTLDPKDYATQQKKSIEWHDKRTKGRFMPGQVTDVHEVAPPGWGHTKAEKEKTDPSKPKSKIGGTAAAFKRALDDGRFKGLPGDKTKKEKTASMFKLMWSMKKKGDKPHYKPGTDKKYKKYQEESFSVKDTKKLQKASILSQSDDPKDQDRARARQVEIDYKDLMRQRKKKKVGVGKSMKEEKKLSPMQDNNLFGNAYAGSQRQKKKAIDAIPDKKSEEYSRNLKHKSPIDPRESVELLGADGKVAHEIVDIIKPEPMKVPEPSMKWKDLVEKVKLPAVNGSIVDVYLTWRGRGISIKLFFPQSRTRRPTREEVNSQIQKVYPGAKVGNFIESDPQPGEPFLQVGD